MYFNYNYTLFYFIFSTHRTCVHTHTALDMPAKLSVAKLHPSLFNPL